MDADRRLREASLAGVAPPRPSRPLLQAFNWYTAWYMWLHFRSLRVAHLERSDAAAFSERPTIIFLNHASWWDPLVCIRIARRLFPGFDHYAPMDATALGRYGFFRKVGMFPIETGTTHGAITFLQSARAVLKSGKSILWITPQGQFTDVRRRPVQFMRGLGALIHRLPECRLIPLTIEYAFWDERLPEILCNFGETVEVADGGSHSVEQWTQRLTSSLEQTSDELAQLVQTRDACKFETLSTRSVGVGGIYQLWLRIQSRRRGKPFHPEHRSIGDA